MTPTVDELRDEIRVAVGRYERVESTGFTKEALAAICTAVDADLETDPIPAKGEMRAAIRRSVEGLAAGTDDAGGPFRKADLEAIAAAVDSE